MAIAFVQSKSATSGSASSTTIAVTLAAGVTSGNALVGIVSWGSQTEAELTSVTDDVGGNTYTLVDFVTDGLNTQSIKGFYLSNITNGPITITANISPARAFRAISVHEVSGMATSLPLDKNTGQLQTAPGTATDGVTSTAVVPTTNGQYIFGGCADTGAGRALSQYAGGTNYTRREEVGSTTTQNLASEDLVQATAASIAATFTATNNDRTLSLILTFKAAAAAAGGTGVISTGGATLNTGLRIPILARFP